MAEKSAICVGVIDGDTFNTNRIVRMRLARVKVPSIDTPEGQYAKALLESLILPNFITYYVVSIDNYGRSVVEVWVNKTNVNDAMRAAGYREMDTISCGTNTEEGIWNTQKAKMSSL
jgi:endonuclease YncB( thermonuclease family)